MGIRAELIVARKEAGLTQREVARRANIDRAFYSHIERGTRGVSLDVALRIAGALGRTLDEIFLPSDVANGHKTSNDIPSTGTDG